MAMVSGLSWDELLPKPEAPPSKPHSLDLYWDFSSPFAYLGYLKAEALVRRTGATLTHRPMLLGALFKQVGQPMVPLSTWSPAKQSYYFADMSRAAAADSLPFRFPTRFPMNSVKALRSYLALPEARRDAFARATFTAYWAHDRDISDDAVLAELVGEGASDILARRETPEIKQALIDSTARAREIGAFGAPTWVVDGKDVFWGQDRLVLVERALLQ
jgi:2-hydroxychromene-2-carboxylate isomerase